MFLRNRHPLWIRLVLILAAISLFVLAYQWGNQYQRRSAASPVIGGLLIRPPASLPDFELREALGRTYSQEDLSQGWTLLAFGDLSRASGQLAVQRLIDVYNRVADERALRKQLRLVLVTTGDDPNLSRDFAGLLPALKLLGGDAEQIERLRADIGLGSAETPAIFVVAPGGYVLAFLPETEGAAQMADDLKAIHAGSELLLPETP
ncbi:SCO family protein [Thiocapsa rosea]|uniref:Cytochrome oxidase Cu insertion factor (SCO1/SenC/PrrC family) n=1 Tax=Thiocapsa rosea TaxID=69360 RepID=A0A495V3W3_9GAMM|nr:hypothetical protein [Thiocapsa rosea]RKT43255.1 cytochrome oxidase Cu insertion factor (SCO1/SenC/PrrC family) [Thiocapsa rosea]